MIFGNATRPQPIFRSPLTSRPIQKLSADSYGIVFPSASESVTALVRSRALSRSRDLGCSDASGWCSGGCKAVSLVIGPDLPAGSTKNSASQRVCCPIMSQKPPGMAIQLSISSSFAYDVRIQPQLSDFFNTHACSPQRRIIAELPTVRTRSMSQSLTEFCRIRQRSKLLNSYRHNCCLLHL